MVKQISDFISRNRITFLAFLVTFAILLINSIHASYPDEFDNIFGGWLINHGTLPWKGFFSHHGAMGYFLAGIITIFSGQSFVRFRLLSVIFFLALLSVSFRVLSKRDNYQGKFFLIYMLVLALAATYFWGHMFLADNLCGYFLIPAYGILFLQIFWGKTLSRTELILISFFSSMAALVSPTYLYAVAVIIGTTFVYYFKNNFKISNFFYFWTIFLTPYLLFALYLVITGSLSNFYFQAITYNQKYYIYNYPFPPGSTTINPIRYAVVIFNNFFNNYRTLLLQVKDYNFAFPFNLTVAISSVGLWIYLLVKRKYLLVLLSFFTLVYATARSNPLQSQVTDYQSAVYFMLSFFNASFLLFNLWTELTQDNTKSNSVRPLYWFTFLLLGIYWFFNIAFLFSQFWGMTYSRYMGTMPLIYDRPKVAPAVNLIVPRQNYCWVGPFEFEEMLHLNCKLPSLYIWILPQFAGIDKVKQEILADHAKNKSDVIVYRRDYTAFFQGPEFSSFFNAFLDKNYIRLKDIPGYNGYHFTLPDTGNFHPDEDFNFAPDKAIDMAAKLKSAGYIKPQ